MTLSHYTLNTGHLRQSPRGEVSRETVQQLEPLLLRALETRTMIRVPDGSGQHAGNLGIVLHTAPESLMATLYWQAGPGAQDIPFAFAATVWSDDAQTAAVAILTKTALDMSLPIHTQPLESPAVLILLLTSAPLIPPPVLMAAADLERCIAWTILAREGLAP